VEKAAQGESFVIAKAGKPLVKVVSLDAPRKPRRLGSMRGQFTVPKDFDRMGSGETEAAFEGTAG
jgi:antitoxin (DNA-binding transcriptional repressor) of toxin-antitoxin stability system